MLLRRGSTEVTTLRRNRTRDARFRAERLRKPRRVPTLTTVAGLFVGLLASSSAAVVAPVSAFGLSATCQAASGVIRDVYGNPVQGALVDTRPSDCSQPTATTNAAGQYSVQIQPSVSGTPATVSGSGYAAKPTTITVTGGSTGTNNVELLYTLAATISPSAVHSGSTITLTGSTTAPAPSAPGYACSWGNGALGDGSTTVSTTPISVAAVGGGGVLSGVTAVTAGRDDGYALMSNGTVVSWGANDWGQLGDGSTSASTTPVLVSGVGGTGTLTGVTAIAGGYDTAFALLSNGEVAAWGDGELGNEPASSSTTTPVLVSGIGGTGTLSGVTAIAASGNGGYARLSNGEVAAWGDNSIGELGNGTGVSSATPVLVSGIGGTGTLSGVTAIAAGDDTAYALFSNGEVAAWGDNIEGQIGNGTTTTTSSTPVLVSGIGGTGVLSGVTAIASAQQTGYALLSDGTEAAWGYGSDGELGNGPNSDPANDAPNSSTTPVHVSAVGGPPATLHNVSAVGAGEYSGYARLTNGTAVGWGYDLDGQLGDNQPNNADSPVYVVAGAAGSVHLTGVSEVASGPLSMSGYAVRAVPCTDTRSAARVIAQSPDGSVVPLSQGGTDASGSTSWSGSYTVPSSAAEGTYGVKFCAVDVTFTGNCDQAAAVGAPALVTTVESLSYMVDNTPPSLYTSTPAPFSDVTNAGTLVIGWSDNLSGVDPSSMSLSIDGAVVTAGVSAAGRSATLSWDASGLAPGIHQVSTQATDNAGNVAPAVSFPITVTSLNAGAATAGNTSATVINSDPSGAAAGPRSVTFHGVQVEVGVFSESLNSSSWVGYGTVGRAATFGPFKVTFKDSTGVVSETSSSMTISVVVPHAVATVSPSAGPMSTLIPATTYTLPDLTVSVPSAFPNTPGSTASLPALSASLGSATPLDTSGHAIARLMPSAFSSGQQIDILGGLTACMARDATGNNATSAKCSANPSPAATVYVNGQQMASLLQPVSGPADTSLNHVDEPTCTGTGGCIGLTGSPTTSYVDSAYSSLSLGCGPYTISVQSGVGATYDLCTGQQITGQGTEFASAYVNAWVFKDATTGHYHLWQQDHVDPGSIASCPDGLAPSGGSPGLTSGVYRAAADTLALDQANGPNIGGSFKRNVDNQGTLDVSLGNITQATYQSNETSGPISGTNGTADFTIDSPSLDPQSLGAGQGYYQVLPDTSVDALGNSLANPSSTANTWTADTSSPLASMSTAMTDTTTSLQLITGTDFATPGPSGGYVFSAQLPFQLAITYGCA